jgi:hypothetical protein
MDAEKQGPSPSSALIALRLAVKRAGGPSAVARTAGINRTHLANILGGAVMGRETAAKLRPHLRLASTVWVELLLPPSPEATP